MGVSKLQAACLASCAAGLVSSAAIAPRALAAGQCQEITIPVQASATNKLILAPTTNLASVSGVTSFLGSVVGLLGQALTLNPVSGTYNISGRYCAPATGGSIPAERANHVQLLLHGIPYTKDYWQGLNYTITGDTNNWHAYASSQGYPSLAIDNVGSGDSDKPDPVEVVQQALETAILHEMILKLRAGTVNAIVPKASKVIFVGHSIGSVIGNGVATRFPTESFDAAILTGYTYTVAQAAIGLLTDEIEPASVQQPARFGGLPPAYLTFGSIPGKTNTYYGADGSYDVGLPTYDVQYAQGTVTIGELVSAFNGLQMAKQYAGDVFVLTGQQDALFCGVGTRVPVPGNCGNGTTSLPAKSQNFWPAAKSYEYYLVPEAGHAVTLHNSAQDQFARAHDYLSRQGY